MLCNNIKTLKHCYNVVFLFHCFLIITVFWTIGINWTILGLAWSRFYVKCYTNWKTSNHLRHPFRGLIGLAQATSQTRETSKNYFFGKFIRKKHFNQIIENPLIFEKWWFRYCWRNRGVYWWTAGVTWEVYTRRIE